MEGKYPVRSMEDLESLGHSMKWQHFEKLTGWVFENNDFEVYVNVIRKNPVMKRQYDVIAENGRHVFAADCKRWAGGRYKASAIKSSVEKHIERCVFLKNFTEKPVIPVIVTLMKEDVIIHDGVPVVPIGVLNTFLNTWERTGGVSLL